MRNGSNVSRVSYYCFQLLFRNIGLSITFDANRVGTIRFSEHASLPLFEKSKTKTKFQKNRIRFLNI